MADVVVQGSLLNTNTPKPELNTYVVRTGRTLSVIEPDGVRTYSGGDSVQLTKSAANAFKDKLITNEELEAAVRMVEHAGDRREQLHTSPVPQVSPGGHSAPMNTSGVPANQAVPANPGPAPKQDPNTAPPPTGQSTARQEQPKK